MVELNEANRGYFYDAEEFESEEAEMTSGEQRRPPQWYERPREFGTYKQSTL